MEAKESYKYKVWDGVTKELERLRKDGADILEMELQAAYEDSKAADEVTLDLIDVWCRCVNWRIDSVQNKCSQLDAAARGKVLQEYLGEKLPLYLNYLGRGDKS